jgi:hypothetical protein
MIEEILFSEYAGPSKVADQACDEHEIIKASRAGRETTRDPVSKHPNDEPSLEKR